MRFTPSRAPHRTSRLRIIVLGGLLLGLFLLTGCKPTPTVDLPAFALDVTITVMDGSQKTSDNKVPVVVQCYSEGQVVRLAGNATVSCNGVAMPWMDLVGYAARIPMVAEGNAYNCIHLRNGATTTAKVIVPPRPVIISPTQGALVTRSNSLTIKYVPGSGNIVRCSAGNISSGLLGKDQSDTGTYGGFDVSSLKAGPGSIGLTRGLTFAPAGTGFKSVQIKYSTGTSINVTWN